jgi:hypothetical protein
VKTIYLAIGLLITVIAAWSQDSVMIKRKWELNGYIKEIESFSVDKDFRNIITNNLLHNRINVKWKPYRSITGALEVRNRIFWGDGVRNTPGFSSLLRNENEWMNLSVVWASRSNFLVQSNIERGWVEFRKTKWNLRLGRQRINWGITSIWNPNDIFNTYNFLDFDYEERPGTDAVKFQYIFDDLSAIEVAVNPVGNKAKSIAAARYSINKWGYDLQILAGMYQNKFTAGFGWAGSLGKMGYKGEGQAFIGEKDSVNRFNFSLELSYVFRKDWNVSGSVLHNTSGIDEPVINFSKINFRPSPMNLMPARWSFITTISKEFIPLFSGNLNLVYSPQVNLFVVYPSLKYTVLENFYVDLIYQSFFLELQNRFQAISHNIFVRLKWSF